MAPHDLTLIASLLLLSLLFLIIRNKRHKNQLLLPPSPPKLPILGNLHQLGQLPHRSMSELSKKYGPVMLLKLGSVPTLVVSSAESAREILRTRDLDCCTRPHLKGTARLSYNCLDIAFSPFGDYWREVRKLCTTKLFSTSKVQSFRSIREEEVSLLMDSIAAQSASYSPVDLGEKLFTLTANVTCRLAFGRSFRGSELDDDGFQELIQETFAMLGSFCASDFFPYTGWILDRLAGFHGRLERCYRDLDAFYKNIIHQHMRSQREEEDVIDTLLRIKNEQQKDAGSVPLQLTQDHIKSILMDVFVGGVDTSALTMVWAMTELARNSRVMKKAQEEVRECVGSKGRVEERDLEQLQYLKMIVKETFRLHPPAPLLIPRETMSSFHINGYNIFPKTRVQVNVWAIGRDPNLWENPEEFFPERFLENPVDFKGQDFELLPFGAGRRSCPGMSMGVAMVELGLANLLYSFDWKLPDGMEEKDIDMEEGVGLTIYKKIPLKLVPVKYNYLISDDYELQ